MKRLFSFKYFLYLALLFLLIYLVREQRFANLEVLHWPSLLLSLLLLFGGFALLAVVWHRSLEGLGGVSFRHAFSSLNLGSMGKYIPGKVATLHGISAYLYERLQLSHKRTALLFVQFNLVYVLTGFLAGGGLLAQLDVQQRYWYALWAGLLLVFFIGFRPIMKVLFRLLTRLWPRFSMDAPLPRFGLWNAGLLLAVWLLWGLGFHLLALALSPDAPGWGNVFSFPFAAAAGNLVIIAPGGLGVREGLLTYVLRGQGMPGETALTLSLASRMWFLLGELSAFALALLWMRRKP
jgi:hypothetical protein